MSPPKTPPSPYLANSTAPPSYPNSTPPSSTTSAFPSSDQDQDRPAPEVRRGTVIPPLSSFPSPVPPVVKPDFAVNALRNPRDYEIITRALKTHDQQALLDDVLHRTGYYAGEINGLVSRSARTRVVFTPAPMLESPSAEGSRSGAKSQEGASRKGTKEVKGEKEKMEVLEDTEEDEETVVQAVKKKKKKKGGQKKGKKAGAVKPEEEPKGKVEKEEEAEKEEVEKLVQAEEGIVGVQPADDPSETVNVELVNSEPVTTEVVAMVEPVIIEPVEELAAPSPAVVEPFEIPSTPASSVETHTTIAEAPESSAAEVILTPKAPHVQEASSLRITPSHLRGSTSPADLNAHSLLGDPGRITVNLPAPRAVSSPANMTAHTHPVVKLVPVVEEAADDTHSTTPPPAASSKAALPSIAVSSPEKLLLSPTATEIDEDEDEGSPRIIGLGGTRGLGHARRGDSMVSNGSDGDFSSTQLAQLTGFAPRPSVPQPAGDVIPEPATPESVTSDLPQTPITPPQQLLSTFPSPLTPHRHISLSPQPTLGSPLRYELVPPPILYSSDEGEVVSENAIANDNRTAKPWSLFFSDTSKDGQSRRANAHAAHAHMPSPEAYQHGLVPIFTADNLVDLFGYWRALRRQIANATGREIEYPHEYLKEGEMGLGLHCMKDDNNFHFFVRGVKPMWEDEMCVHGGKFMFAGPGDKMDSLFFDLVLLLISDRLSDDCPPNPGSGSQVLGISLSRRMSNTRLEVWVGGPGVPEREWIRRVQEVFVREARGERLYEYKPFHPPSTAAGGGGGGGGGGAGSGRGMGMGGVAMGKSSSGGAGPARSPMGGMGGGGGGMGRSGPGPGQGQGQGQGMFQGVMKGMPMARSLSMGL
ncbi:uncharacterized protein MKK02DRAFT_42311 [Dioszegia hungarica]|uniref:Uncharacterized protein n=1 Tax=Dioszegia hungarica TaxID=4972 RepID=A0AA38LV63_9TREE|nr:uncharacterized protein MKK02DRAFT_42311 [Dioszegia hungarica]KAI9637932.1 hypothetical protein MKK02DRAFT_42311 [Dioszegia hungarica]